MRRRAGPYAFVLMVALVLSLVPPAIFADLATPFASWENWYWKGQPHARPQFNVAQMPPALRAEIVVFKALSAPPSWVCAVITGYPTVYAAQFGSGIIYETAGVPPLAFALWHMAWAVPVWFGLGILMCEGFLLLRSRKRVG